MDKVSKRVRKEVPFMDHDREIRLDIEKVERLVRSEELNDLFRKYIG